MDNQNLQFNILSFDWPQEEVTFYFNPKGQPNSYRLHQSLFPHQLGSVLPEVERSGVAFVATSFDQPTRGFVPLDIDLKYDNKELVKLYFHYKLHAYFSGLENMVVRPRFEQGVAVWVPAYKSHTEAVLVYECFRLRVQFGVVGSLPELLVRYERAVEVSRQSVSQLVEHVPTALFRWLLVGNRLVKYADYMQEEETDFGSALPVLNQETRKVLGMPGASPGAGRPYHKHWRYIRGFYRRFLDHEHFRAVLAIHHEFLRVDPRMTRRLPYTEQEQPLVGGTGLETKGGVGRLRPYQKSPHGQIHLFFVVHRKDVSLIETVKRYFFRGVGQFKGLSQYAQLNLHPQRNMDIIFDNLADPVREIRMALYASFPKLAEGVSYVAVYISPYRQDDPDPWRASLYHLLKVELLKSGIVTQVLDAEKLRQPEAAYEAFLPCISVAMLAKLGGVPWRVRVPVQHELVAGVGTFRGKGDAGCQMAVGMSFSNEGRFFGFDCFREDQVEILAGCISHGVRKFAETYHYPRRLVVHMNRKYNNRELRLLERALARLEFPTPIPIFFVSLYGPASEDLLAFDTSWKGLMPYSGTVVKVGVQQYLLFNNMRYAGGCFEEGDGAEFVLPVKVRVDCTGKVLLQDEEGVLELLGQVHQFSRMNWRGIRQQGMPVTVRYAEMVARMVGHLPGGRMPEGGKRGLWFL